MSKILLKRDDKLFYVNVIYVKNNQSTSSNRDAFGAVYTSVNEFLTILAEPNIDIRKGDKIIYNDFELEIGSVIFVEFNGTKYLLKAVAMI